MPLNKYDTFSFLTPNGKIEMYEHTTYKQAVIEFKNKYGDVSIIPILNLFFNEAIRKNLNMQ